MAAVMRVISSGSGKGKSTVSRYIAERDRDPEKEGKEKRTLFSKDREGMTYRNADKVLAKGAVAPEKEDVIHVAVSLRPGDYERLGKTNEERSRAFMLVTREAMQEVEKDLGARDMVWVAGIHQNTDNPHVHIAINKNMSDGETGRPKRIETIPRDMRGTRTRELDNSREAGRSQELEIDFQGGAGGDGRGGKAEPEHGERGKMTERFDDAIDHIAGPVTMIGFHIADRDSFQRRSVFDERKRQPTEDERLVGRWVVAEASLRPGDETASRERGRLRSQVTELDRDAAISGQAKTAAFIPTEELRAALDKGQLTALNSAGHKHTPYDAGDLVKEASERDPVLRDRTTLGQEIASRFRAEYFSEKVIAAESQASVRRYTINDVSLGLERKSSVSDLQGRAGARGQRAAEMSGAQTGSERREIKSETYARDVERHAPNIEEIEKAHAAQVEELTKKRDKALDAHDRLVLPTAKIEQEYRAKGEQQPTPIISRATLDELHEQSVERRDPERIIYINNLRSQLSIEFGGHARNNHSATRLGAQTEIARQDFRVSEQREDKFDKTAHLRKWELDDGRKLSLADVDKETKYRKSEIEFHEKRAEYYEKRLSFWGSFSLPSVASLNPVNQIKATFTRNPFSGFGSMSFGPTINPFRRAEYRQGIEEARDAAQTAREKIEELKPVRDFITDKIETQRAELSNNVSRDHRMMEALSSTREAEAADRVATGREMPESKYKGWELRRMESNAEILRDSEGLRAFEKEIGPGREGINLEGRASRAFAREIHAEIGSIAAKGRLESFEEHQDHYPLGYRDAEGNLQTGTLSEVKPHSLMERLTDFISPSEEKQELRATLEAAAKVTYNNLLDDHEKAAEYFKSVQGIANDYRAALQERGPEQQMPAPEFTRKELADIERYGESIGNEDLHKHYDEFVRGVIENDQVGNHPVGQAFADLVSSKPGIDPEPETSWQQTQEPSSPDMNQNDLDTAKPETPVEITGASMEIESGAAEIVAALL